MVGYGAKMYLINKSRDLILNNLGIKYINDLRKIKWYILDKFRNDSKIIKNYYKDEVELQVLEQILPNLIESPTSVILDIGANIGMYSLHLSSILPIEGKCIGFEPRKDVYHRLKKNVINDRFKAENLALSNKEGVTDIYLPTSHGRSSLVWQEEFEGFKSEKIRTTTLDEFVSQHDFSSITFIKIDVEGHEMEVLEGAQETLKTYSPLILCESENRHLKIQGKSTEEVIKKMENLGYKSFVISKASREFIPIEEISIPKNKPKQGEYFFNFWFVPKEKLKKVRTLVEESLRSHL
jgi:FkbM family methyltransferase